MEASMICLTRGTFLVLLATLVACLAAVAPGSSFADEPTAEQQPRISPEELNEEALYRKEIQLLLADVVRLRRTGDPWEFGALFDIQRFIRETGRQGTLDKAGLPRVLSLWLALKYQLTFGGFSLQGMDVNDRTAISCRLGAVRFTKTAGEPPEAEAFVQFSSEAAEPFWMRLWLVRRGNFWRIFDNQHLESGQRFSCSLAEIGTAALPARANWRRSKELVDLAWQSIQYGYGDENGVQANLNAAARLSMHPATDLRRRVYEIIVAYNAMNFDGADKLLKSLLASNAALAEQPLLGLWRTRIAHSRGRFEEAVAAAEAFSRHVGDDKETCALWGNSLLELKQPEKAVSVFRRGLEIEPNAIDCLTGLAKSLPAEQQAEVGQHFARLDDPREWFESVALELKAANLAEALLAVVEAYRKTDTTDPDADYYEAMAWMMKEEPRRAARLLKSAMPRVADEDERSYYRSAYHEAMIAAGQILEAYRDSPEPVAAFKELAQLLDQQDARKDLRALAAEHQEQHPRDPLLAFYLAGVEQRDENLDEADELLAAGMRWATDADTLEQLRVKRVEIRFAAGDALGAYRDIPPRRKTFADLAHRLNDAENFKILEELVAIHRRHDPRDPLLAIWEAEVHWAKKDYTAAARILLAARDRLRETDYSPWMVEERLVRSLIRAQRFEEAENLALDIQERDDNAWFALLVYAAWGDERKALIAAEACSASYSAEEMYDDPDLGSALRKPEMKQFRQKYPPPAMPQN